MNKEAAEAVCQNAFLVRRKSLKVSLFSQLGSHPQETTYRFSQTQRTAHGFQIRNSLLGLKQRKSPPFSTVSQVNHFSPTKE